MALNTSAQFDETALTDAEFDPQDKVLPNSPVESNDVNAIASRALRRSARLRAIKSVVTTSITVLNDTGFGSGAGETFNTFPGYSPSAYVINDLASVAVGDRIDVSLLFDVTGTVVAGDFSIKLVAVEDYGGAATETDIPGAKRSWRAQSTDRYTLALNGLYTIGLAGPLRVIMHVSLPSGGTALNNYRTGALIVRHTHVGA